MSVVTFESSESRFDLILMASQRARQISLNLGKESLITEKHKPTVIALLEIMQNLLPDESRNGD